MSAISSPCPDRGLGRRRWNAPKKPLPARPVPIPLPLFAQVASLVRVRLELNEWRFYRQEVCPDLFGCALLLRQWGRVGTEGRRRLDPYPDPGAAVNGLPSSLAPNDAAAIRTEPHYRPS